jgi:hypothetical protein
METDQVNSNNFLILQTNGSDEGKVTLLPIQAYRVWGDVTSI